MNLNLSLVQIIFSIIIPSLITGIPALIGAINAKKSKKKRDSEVQVDEADAAEKVSNAYDKVVADMQTRIDKMEIRQTVSEKKIEHQERRINFLENGVRKLVTQVRGLGAEPVFSIDDMVSFNQHEIENP